MKRKLRDAGSAIANGCRVWLPTVMEVWLAIKHQQINHCRRRAVLGCVVWVVWWWCFLCLAALAHFCSWRICQKPIRNGGSWLSAKPALA
jgi:hypothetical protein